MQVSSVQYVKVQELASYAAVHMEHRAIFLSWNAFNEIKDARGKISVLDVLLIDHTFHITAVKCIGIQNKVWTTVWFSSADFLCIIYLLNSNTLKNERL